MKMVLLAMLSLMSCLLVKAQGIEVLDSIRVEADPMLSIDVGRLELRSNHVVIEIHDNGIVKWYLQNPPHIFVEDKDAFGHYKGYCDIKVGLYKEDGTLLSMSKKWRAIPSEHGSFLQIVAKGTVENTRNERMDLTIVDWLFASKTQRGSYFRVVSPVYGDYLMDVKFRIPDRWYWLEGEYEKFVEQFEMNKNDTQIRSKRRK